MVRLFLFVAVVMPGAAGLPVDLAQGWRYALTSPRTTPPAQADWKQSVEPMPGRDLWYRVPLPAQIPAEPRLVFRAYSPWFDVFVDGQRVYTFDEPRSGGRLRLHVATLPRDAAGRTLYFRFPPGGYAPHLGGIPTIAAARDVPRALMRVSTQPLRGELEDVIVGAILIVIGIASVVISRIRRNTNAGALLWFGVFATLYGARLIADSYLLLLAGVSTRQADYLESWITYVITIPGWTLTRKLLGDGWKSSLRWQVWVFAIFAPIGLLSDFIGERPGTLEPVNNILVVLGGLNILGNAIYTRSRPNREVRVVLVGAIVFMLFALLNNLAALGILPASSIDETPGFLVFVATLNYAAVRVFLRGERDRVALEGELATAREIQRSILPTTMPDVRGLRFAARYDPASSVAGDLYDFVAVDATHAGVLVADVAGHGVPAALIASMVKVAVSSHARLANDPATLMRELNATLLRDVRRNFVTATYLWLDMEQRTVTVTNAGHAPPVIVRGDDILELGPHGVLLGRFAIASYAAGTVALQTGDRVVAWTDGIIEARNRRGEAFSEERLYDLLRRGATADAVVDAVHAWRSGDTTDADDLTIVIVDVA